MSQSWHYWVGAILIGYLIGYYWRGLGNATVGKLMASGG